MQRENLIQQQRGDVLFTAVLSKAGVAFDYNPAAPETVSLMLWSSTSGPSGLSTFTVNNLSSKGLVSVGILESDLLLGVDNFKILVYSQTDVFDAQIFDVELAPATADQQVSTILTNMALNQTALTDELTLMKAMLSDILAIAEFNMSRKIVWSEDGTQIEALDITLFADDQTDFTGTPDKKYRVTYIRDINGKLIDAQTKEVAL